MKTCKRCGKEKQITDFHLAGSRGRFSWCKDCYNTYKRERERKHYNAPQRRKWNLSSRYGLTEGDFDKLLLDQGNKCKLCGCELVKYHIDHDHATGGVRGILCHQCNIRIGGWDDAEWRSKAMEYLKLCK